MNILLAIDRFSHSDAAIREVARRRWPASAEVRLLTVEPLLYPGLVRGGSPTALDAIVRNQRSAALKRLREAVTMLKRLAPRLRVTPLFREGWPAPTILKEAESWGAHRIVMGSRGFGALRRFFQPSVSLEVASNARCSVEIVRAPALPPEAALTRHSCAAPNCSPCEIVGDKRRRWRTLAALSVSTAPPVPSRWARTSTLLVEAQHAHAL